MAASQEPEKYSIDEMMERLQNRPGDDSPEDGELVVRADGTTAIKVRRRKRRSHQPHKEKQVFSRRAKIIQVAASLVLLLLAVFACVVALVYANSLPFREGLIGMITAHTGGKVELSQFRMTPTRANAGEIRISWPDGSVIGDISCRGVSASIAPPSFLGKSMKGEEVTSPEGTLTLRAPDTAKPRRVEDQPVRDGDITFKSLSCTNLTVLLGDKAYPTARINKTEATLVPSNSKGVPQLLLNRGELAIPGWPKLLLDRSYIAFRGTTADVVGMRFHAEKDSIGFFEVSGTVSPYESANASVLAVQLKTFPLSGIVGPEWSRMFSGLVDSRPVAKSNFVSLRTGPDLGAGSFEVSFTGSAATPFQVGKFPFLMAIGRIADDAWYENPRFEDDTSGVLRRADGCVFFEKLDFSDKSRMALRGSISSSADLKLSGQLKVGLADAVVVASKNAKLNHLFGPPDEGFRWLTLKISGTVMSPADNFRELYEAAPETTASASDGAEPPSFEELTTPGQGR